MFSLKRIRFISFAIALTMALLLALSSITLADHSRKRGRQRDKKSEKFINGHDARDGRWDGRGPRVRDRRDRRDDDDFCCNDRRSRRKRRW